MWLPPLVLAVQSTIVLFCTISQNLDGLEKKPELEATAPNMPKNTLDKNGMMRNKHYVALNIQYNIQWITLVS